MAPTAEAVDINLPNCEISPQAVISRDCRIVPSQIGTLIKIGSGTHIFEFVVIRAVGGIGDVIIGENCYINPHCAIYSGNGVRMGDDVLLAAGVVIAPTNHAFERRDTPIRKQGFMPSRGGVVIEEDVWIGSNATLLDGAYIEKGAIIAAGSVVMGRVTEYSVWGGVPAKFIKSRP